MEDGERKPQMKFNQTNRRPAALPSAEGVAQASKPAVSRVSKPANRFQHQARHRIPRPADLEVGDTAGLETCATHEAAPVRHFLHLEEPRAARFAFLRLKTLVYAGLLALITQSLFAQSPTVLLQSKPLEWAESDLSGRLMDGAHRFVERKISESLTNRSAFWARDFSS